MDYIKHHIMHLTLLAAFGAACIIMQKIAPSAPGQKTWRRESRLDLAYWAVSVFIISYVAAFMAALLLNLMASHYPALLHKLNSPSPEPGIAEIIIALVALDFISYWLHRAFHTSHLWDYHAIHHSSEEIDWLSSTRFHPLESLLVAVIGFTLCIAMGLGFKAVGIGLAVRAVYGFVVHANVRWHFGWFGHIVASPHFHRWHHTKEREGLDKNFGGVFSIWDFIFGTAYFPRGQQPHNFGVSGNVGDTFLKQLKYPFRRHK